MAVAALQQEALREHSAKVWGVAKVWGEAL